MTATLSPATPLTAEEALEFGPEPEEIAAPVAVPLALAPRRTYKKKEPEPPRTLPAAPESEQAVLCSILKGYAKLDSDELRELKPDMFHVPAHVTIYRACYQLREDGKPIDLITVTQLLADENLLDEIGGAAYLAKIQTLDALAANYAEYAATIIEKWKLREGIRAAGKLEKALYEAQGRNPDEIFREHLPKFEALKITAKDAILPPRRFDISAPPEKPVPSLYLAGQGVCTAGNLTQIIGQAKTAKSALVGAILANAMDGREHLGIHGAGNTSGRALVHFDTEQSRYDHHQLVMRAMHRAGVSTPPDWLRSYSLADVSTGERRRLLAQEIEAASKAHGGIYQAIVDGVADLCHDPNDPEEAFDLVAELHRLAISCNASILAVLHLNPGSDFKTRGHLGSQLERKAESTLQLDREKDGEAITLWLPPSRHGYIQKDEGPRFVWDDESGRHEIIEGSRREAKAAAKSEADLAKWQELARMIFAKGPRSYKSTVEALQATRNVIVRTAEKNISAMTVAGVVRKNLMGDYELAED